MTATKSNQFVLDREELEKYLDEEYGTINPVTLSTFDGTPFSSKTIAEAFQAAQDADAVPDVDGLEAIVYDVDGAVLVAVRPRHSLSRVPQVCTTSIEVKTLLSEQTPDDFDGIVLVVELLLSYANDLVPAVQLLEAGKRYGGC